MNRVIYNNFMPNAEQECQAPASDSERYMHAGELLSESEKTAANFATLEGRGIELSDYSLILAEGEEGCCFISSRVSNAAGVFQSPVCLCVSVKEGYGFSHGVTLQFHGAYCSKLTLTAYNGETQVATGVFEPTGLSFYCDLEIEKFTKLYIFFQETQTPYQLVKLERIFLGKQNEIGEFLGEIEIFNEIAVDCDDLPGSTCDFQAVFGEARPLEGQRLLVQHNGETFGAFSIESVSETQNGIYAIEAIDDVFALENIGMGSSIDETITVSAFLERLENAGIKAKSTLDEATVLSGTVTNDGKTTMRELAAMVSFATGSYFLTAREKQLKITKSRELNRLIGADRILGKPKCTTKTPYTKITVQSGDTATVLTNPDRRSGQAGNELVFGKFKLSINPTETAAEIAARGWQRNEISATIILQDERVGDIVDIEVSGEIKHGIIRSMAVHLRRKSAVADIEITELAEVRE